LGIAVPACAVAAGRRHRFAKAAATTVRVREAGIAMFGTGRIRRARGSAGRGFDIPVRRIEIASTPQENLTMRKPSGPGPIPSLMPFIALAVALLVIYGGLLLFPVIKDYINQQDCIGTGRTNC
jgi:hypothetical protein